MRRLLCSGLLIAFSSVAFAQNDAAFDIRTVDPGTFRAIAFKISGAHRPSIDGELTDEVWALAPASAVHEQRAELPSEPVPRSGRNSYRVRSRSIAVKMTCWLAR